MKVAIVTTDGKTVSLHFGRSPYYKIFTIENGRVVQEEMRERGTGHFAHGRKHESHERGTGHFARGRKHESHERGTGHFARGRKHESHERQRQNGSSQGHGYGPEADAKHAAMAEEIADCDMLIAGGMGRGAYESFSRAGLSVVLTDMLNIDDVVHAVINGSLENLAYTRTD